MLASGMVLASAAWPWLRTWPSVRGTSLRHAWLWLGMGGGAVLLAGLAPWLGLPLLPVRHLALVSLASFPLAVLGARLPGVGAWNFVVCGWFAAALLPHLQQSWDSPTWHLDTSWLLFLAGVLAMGVSNYLPTRFFFAALLLGGMLAWNLWSMRLGAGSNPVWELAGLQVGLGLAGWLAWVWPAPESKDVVSRRWLQLRDAYGLAWGVRIQEQVQAAARHAEIAGQLTWFGLEPAEDQPLDVAGWQRLLDAVRTKFMPEPIANCRAPAPAR